MVSGSYLYILRSRSQLNFVNTLLEKFSMYSFHISYIDAGLVGCFDLVIFQPYLDLEAGDNQSLKNQVARGEWNPGPLAPQAKSLTTRPPLLLIDAGW